MKLTFVLALVCITPFLVAQKKSSPVPVNAAPGAQVNTGGKFGDVEWQYHTAGRINATPVLHNGIIYAGSADKFLHAIDAGTGKEVWRFATGGPVHSTPAIHDGKVCFLSFDGNFYVVNARTGREIRRFKTGGEQWYGQKGLWGMSPPEQHMEDLFQYWLSSPVLSASSDNVVYFGSSDHHLYALDLRTGKPKWKFRTSDAIHTTPAVNDGIVFVGSWDRNIYAVDAKTGVEKWRFATRRDDSGWGGMQGLQASPVVYRGKVLCGSRDGSFYALDEKTGKLLWEYKTGGTWIVGSAVAHDGKVYVGTSDTFTLLVLDVETGELIKSYQSNGYIYSAPVVSGKFVFFGTFTGKIVSVDLESNAIAAEWQTDSGVRNSPVVLKDGKIDFSHLFEGLDGKKYEDNVTAVRKLDQLGPIVATPLIQEGFIYVASGDGKLYKIELNQ